MNALPQKSVNFLLVDDREENLMSLEALLRRDDLTILKARSGHEALELLLKHEIALAFLDVQMPEMDGFELAELMRGIERTRRVPIIFVTAGSADSQRRFRGYEAGAVDFLHKPIESDIIRSKAAVFFELYRQQQQLEQQRDELKAYAEALKDNDRRKDEFLATLAHELRNPLAPIRSGLYILQNNPADNISEDIRGMMDRQLDHLVRLIDDLMDVARVSQGKINLRKERITLQEVIRAAVESSKPLIEVGKHTLTLNVPEKTIWIDADLTRLAQVVNNLLNNAAKYTAEGGHISLKAHLEDSNVRISISDNGVGIPADMLPKVFDLFTQVNGNMERTKGGLGIGLALVKRLVEMHGGEIKSESPGIDQGSTFTVTLPYLPQEESTETIVSTVNSSSTEQQKMLRVLVVDDNVDSAKTTGWMLEFIGHQPTLVHDGLQALEAAKQQKPDIIMLDIGLPNMNGYDVCRELRKDPLFKDTIMIAQTGWGQERDRQQAKDAGFNHHLVKPVRMEQITDLLKKYATLN